jgi:hypothetical protein
MEREENAIQYSEARSFFYKSYIKHLKNHFNITNVGYSKFFFNNKYFYICSDTNISNEHITKIRKTEIWFENYINSYKGYHLIGWPQTASTDAMKIFLAHGYWNGATIFKKQEDGIELYWVAGNKDNSLLNNLYITKSKLLLKAISVFAKELKDSFFFSENNDLPVFSEGVNFSSVKEVEQIRIQEREKIEKFFQKLKEKKEFTKRN